MGGSQCYGHHAYIFRLLDLDELEREDILASRQEEMQKYKDSLNINRLFSAAQAGGEDNVASAAKRSHTQTGATTEKKSKLEELKSKREAKTKKRSRNVRGGIFIIKQCSHDTGG